MGEPPEAPARVDPDDAVLTQVFATTAAGGARLSSVVGRLTAVNIAIAAAGILTGPLQARALGPEGRGELAAIFVPLIIAPMLLSLALGAYVGREIASGRKSVAELIGSVGPLLLVMTLIGMAAGFPVAELLAGGDEVIHDYLIIGFMALPIGMIGTLLVALMAGMERWRMVIFMRLVPIALPFIAIVWMYIFGEMTVARIVIVTIVAGGLAIIPAIVAVARAGRPVFRVAIARASLSFGLRTWLGGLAQLANVRMDQLLMITLVSDSELGLYAVAVTLAGMSNFVLGAISPPLITRVAQGDKALIPQALRIVLLTVGALNLSVAALTPVLLPLIFGSAFEPAVDQAIVLLLAGVPFAGLVILSAALAADGAPGTSSIGEGMALVITVPGLFLLVPSMGGLGAALVSLVAYGLSFGYQLLRTRRRLGGPMRSYLFPQTQDLEWLRERIKRRRSV